MDDVIGRKTAILKEQSCKKAAEVQHTQGETQDRQAKEPPESLSLPCWLLLMRNSWKSSRTSYRLTSPCSSRLSRRLQRKEKMVGTELLCYLYAVASSRLLFSLAVGGLLPHMLSLIHTSLKGSSKKDLPLRPQPCTSRLLLMTFTASPSKWESCTTDHEKTWWLEGNCVWNDIADQLKVWYPLITSSSIPTEAGWAGCLQTGNTIEGKKKKSFFNRKLSMPKKTNDLQKRSSSTVLWNTQTKGRNSHCLFTEALHWGRDLYREATSPTLIHRLPRDNSNGATFQIADTHTWKLGENCQASHSQETLPSSNH